MLVMNVIVTVGQEFTTSTMCTALRKAGIPMPDWNRIGKELSLNQQMPISAEIFFES